jgi:hypothetical protein
MMEAVRRVALISGQELWKLTAMGRGRVGTWEASGPCFGGPETERRVHRHHKKEGTMKAAPKRTEQEAGNRINQKKENAMGHDTQLSQPKQEIVLRDVTKRVTARLYEAIETEVGRELAEVQDGEKALRYFMGVGSAVVEVLALQSAVLIEGAEWPRPGTTDSWLDAVERAERFRKAILRGVAGILDEELVRLGGTGFFVRACGPEAQASV